MLIGIRATYRIIYDILIDNHKLLTLLRDAAPAPPVTLVLVALSALVIVFRDTRNIHSRKYG